MISRTISYLLAINLTLILSCSSAALAVAAADGTVSDRAPAIRAAIKSPELSLKINFTYNYSVVDGFMLQWRTRTAARKRDAAEEQIRSGRADAAAFYDFAEASSELGDKKAASDNYERAANLFKKEMKMVPAPRSALAGYAETLIQMQRQDKAVAALRRGLAQHPGNWMAWLELANTLTGQTSNLLWGAEADQIPAVSVAGPDNSQKYWSAVIALRKKDPPKAAAIAKAEAAERESETAFDRAVTAAPAEPWPLFERGMSRALTLPGSLLKVAKGGSPPASSGIFDLAAADPDIQAAARLAPADYKLQAAAALFTITGAMFHGHGAGWDKLTPEQRTEITADMNRIRKVAQAGSHITASNAFMSLSVLQLLTQKDAKMAVQSAREALDRDPANDFAFELVAGEMEYSKDYAGASDFCKAQLERHDSALRRVILARAESELNDNAAAEQDARAALHLSPRDFDANLTLAELLLKNHIDPAWIGEASQLLGTASKILGKDHTSDRWAAYALVDAAYLGITGHADAARPLLNEEVKSAPSEEEKTEAKDLLAALGP